MRQIKYFLICVLLITHTKNNCSEPTNREKLSDACFRANIDRFDELISEGCIPDKGCWAVAIGGTAPHKSAIIERLLKYGLYDPKKDLSTLISLAQYKDSLQTLLESCPMPAIRDKILDIEKTQAMLEEYRLNNLRR